LREITDAALPGEDLSEDELAGILDEGTILAASDGTGAALTVGPGAPVEPTAAVVALLVVVPGAQGRGVGRALLEAARRQAVERGATAVWAGSGQRAVGPCLWPGVDIHATRALCLFEATGFRVADTVLHAACPTTFRRSPPPGIEVRRVLEDDDARAAIAIAEASAPSVAGDVARAVDHGSCLLASDPDRPIGIGCHSVHRVGWIGPVVIAPSARRRGVGAAVLAALCADLRAAGRPEAEIAWADPLGFYARAAGASVSRVYRRLVWTGAPA
jgi:GNAT superfamily N-acetyltransferase